MRSNLADLVREAAVRRPAHTALVSETRTLTWAEVDAEVDAVAAALQARGLAHGDRVAMVLGNCWEFVAVYFGALRGGFVAVPLNPGLTEYELAYVLADASPRLAFVGPVELAAVRGAAPDLDVVLVGGTGDPC